jgi:hypothetical protein
MFSTLAPGESRVVTIVAALGCAVPDGSAVPVIGFVASDSPDANAANNAAGVTVVASNAPPTIEGAALSRSTLLLPLHQMVLVTVSHSAGDSCGPAATSLTVTSDEPVLAPLREQGLAGLTSPDWHVIDAHHVLLRAERSLRGDGRVYTIRVRATDAAGGNATGELTVTVPRRIAGWKDDDPR